MANRYTLDTKMAAIESLRDGNYDSANYSSKVPISTLRKWYRQRESIRRAYEQQLRDEAALTMLKVQNRVADKAAEMVNAIDEERIKNAPLNQIASTLGVLVDRYLKLEGLQEETEETEKVIRFEFRNPDGSLTTTPPWPIGNPQNSPEVQSSSVRETLGEEFSGKANGHGEGYLSRDENVVADPDLPDGKSNVARDETFHEERDWYHD